MPALFSTVCGLLSVVSGQLVSWSKEVRDLIICGKIPNKVLVIALLNDI